MAGFVLAVCMTQRREHFIVSIVIVVVVMMLLGLGSIGVTFGSWTLCPVCGSRSSSGACLQFSVIVRESPG